MNDKINNVILDIKNHPLEYLTMLLAFAGSILSSGEDDILRGWGFAIWILSNGYMLIGFMKVKNIPYSLLFFGYECMNLRGVISNWF